MEIVIIGAGALGCLFGALLAAHASVTLYTTNSDHARVINEDGLLLTGMDGRRHNLALPVLTAPEQYDRRADLILICTKARSTGAAAGTAEQLLAADGLVLTLQNGLGNLEQIAARVGSRRAAAGITAQGATLQAPGRVLHAGNGATVLAVGPGQDTAVAAVVGLFNRAGLDADISHDVDALLWSKLIVNVGINGLAAMLRVPNGTLTEVDACRNLLDELVTEAMAVARALRIDLDYEEQLDRVHRVCRQTSANRASMLQDVLRKVPTEIDVINGAVVAKGRETGIATPANQFLTRMIKALEATAGQRVST
ncbi:MAG: 2-dehydropantoate 2-reductase [Desulfobulbus sp.]|nr:2-dehydropantoate 2-reductase [Desulfobulbus sp.]